MTFNKAAVLRNWDQAGLDFVQDLSAAHGPENVPEPLEGQTLHDYAQMCARANLIADIRHTQNLQEVERWKIAEARGIPVYDLSDTQEDPLADVAAELRALPVTERLKQYRSQRDALLKE